MDRSYIIHVTSQDDHIYIYSTWVVHDLIFRGEGRDKQSEGPDNVKDGVTRMLKWSTVWVWQASGIAAGQRKRWGRPKWLSEVCTVRLDLWDDDPWNFGLSKGNPRLFKPNYLINKYCDLLIKKKIAIFFLILKVIAERSSRFSKMSFDAYNWIREVNWWRQKFEETTFTWMGRNGNQVADFLAKHTLHQNDQLYSIIMFLSLLHPCYIMIILVWQVNKWSRYKKKRKIV